MRQRRKFVQQTSIVTPTQPVRMLEKTGSGRSEASTSGIQTPDSEPRAPGPIGPTKGLTRPAASAKLPHRIEDDSLGPRLNGLAAGLSEGRTQLNKKPRRSPYAIVRLTPHKTGRFSPDVDHFTDATTRALNADRNRIVPQGAHGMHSACDRRVRSSQ
jgi:hypothetical protein